MYGSYKIDLFRVVFTESTDHYCSVYGVGHRYMYAPNRFHTFVCYRPIQRRTLRHRCLKGELCPLSRPVLVACPEDVHDRQCWASVYCFRLFGRQRQQWCIYTTTCPRANDPHHFQLIHSDSRKVSSFPLKLKLERKSTVVPPHFSSRTIP